MRRECCDSRDRPGVPAGHALGLLPACNPSLEHAKKEGKRKSRPISRVLSGTIIHLRCMSPRTFSSLPEPSADHAIGFLFGLAPGGVYPATRVATRAVRSYRTISPLPRKRGGIFSVALSVGSRLPGITWHPVLRSPDFPPPQVAAIVWPTLPRRRLPTADITCKRNAYRRPDARPAPNASSPSKHGVHAYWLICCAI